MIRKDDLQAAVSEGIIDQAQAVRIAHLARTRLAAATAPPDAVEPAAIDPDDERFRLIGGFNDVFVAIGVCLLAGALLGLARVLGFGDAFAVTAALAAWGLSEIFARRMRLALPSILLAAMFAASVATAAGLLGGATARTEPFSAIGIAASGGFALAALLSQGIGSGVIRRFVAMLQAEGHRTIIIDPDPANIRAVSAYRKAGFRPVPRLEGWTDGVLIMQFQQDIVST